MKCEERGGRKRRGRKGRWVREWECERRMGERKEWLREMRLQTGALLVDMTGRQTRQTEGKWTEE